MAKQDETESTSSKVTTTGKPPGNHAPRTQAGRRLTYGLNVLVVILVAIAITGLVNYIGYAYLFSFRKDLTAAGDYSLSPQTRKVLEATTKPVRIISLFSGSSNPDSQARIDKAQGLVDEYGYVTKNVSVEHIDPARQPARLDAFYQTIYGRYADQLAPLDKAVSQGLKSVNQIQKLMKSQITSVNALLQNNQMPQGKLPETLLAVQRVITQQEADFGDYRSQIQKAMDRPLADYGGAVNTLSTLLEMIDKRLFGQAISLLSPFTNDQHTPAAIKNELLTILDQFNQARLQIKPMLDDLSKTKPLPAYDALYQQLANPNVVVLVGQKSVSVVTLSQMFKAADAGQGASEPQFLGEEKITGALLGMEQTKMPLVVFVSSNRFPALGQRGMLKNLGQRLSNMHFRVEEWNADGRQGPMGRMLPAGDPPKADPGQKTVWIVLPMAQGNPMMPMQGGGAQRVTSLMRERAAAGDGEMLIFSYNNSLGMGVPDPMNIWAQDWGITVQNDRMILREQLLPDRTTVARGALRITQWPDTLPITRALSGFSAVFGAASPLVLSAPATEPSPGDQADPQTNDLGDLKLYPLAVVRGQGLWADKDPSQTSKLKPESAADHFIIAAAAQKDGARMVAVADPAWMTDRFTTLPSFPGNAELFVNSVYWLSGLDQMIAASARTQDIRRVSDISPKHMLVLRWIMMLGMPLVVAGVGMGVWLVRRRA